MHRDRTNSDHYQVDDQKLGDLQHAFEAFGVRFAEEGRQRDSGYGDGLVALVVLILQP